MRKIAYSFFLFMSLFFSSCSEEYDDTDLRNDITDLENRVQALEELCKNMNTNISSLQTLVESLQNNDYITNITPITLDEEVIGYTIEFLHNNPITIYNGENGQDGNTPQIAIKQDTDGIYYWTLNGEWIIDNTNNKIPAQGDKGEDGKDGVTPKLKIENGHWYISYDNEASWIDLGLANEDSDYSLFESVDTSNERYVIFKLSNGEYFSLPIYQDMDITFEIDDLQDIGILPNIPVTIPFHSTGLEAHSNITFIASDNLKVEFSGNAKEGIFTITSTTSLNDSFGASLLVFLSSGDKTIVKGLAFKNGNIEVVDNNIYYVDSKEQLVDIPIYSNLHYQYTVEENAKNWITPIQSRGYSNCKFSISQNTGTARYGIITFSDNNNIIQENIYIAQKGNTDESDYMEIQGEQAIVNLDKSPSPIDLAVAFQQADKNGIRHFILKGKYENLGIKTEEYNVFNPLQSATNVEVIDLSQVTECDQKLPDGLFSSCGTIDGTGYVRYFNSLKNVILPNEVMELGNSVFDGCVSLETINLEKIVKIGKMAFGRCEKLKSLNAPNLTSIGECAFWLCTSLKSINCPNLQSIERQAFQGCTSLSSVTLQNLTSLDGTIFSDCTSLTSANFPNVIEFQALYGCTSLSELKLTSPNDINVSINSWNESKNIHLYLNKNKQDEVSNGNTWKGAIWKEISFE